MRSLTGKIHYQIYAGTLILLAIALPFSKFVISLTEMILILNWLWEGDLKNKLRSFSKNKVAIALSLLYIIHLLGLLYTTDFNYGLEDVRKKIPLLLLPLIFSTSPALSAKDFKMLSGLFIAAVFVGTLISMGVLFRIIPHQVNNIRDISIFVSHIRFSLMICLASCFLGYFIYHTHPFKYKLLYTLLILWFAYFLIILESLTGLIILFIIGTILFSYFIINQKKVIYKLSALSALLLIIVSTWLYCSRVIKDYNKSHEVNFASLEKTTLEGNAYVHDTLNTEKENGYPVWINICEPEMAAAWNKRSLFIYSGKDKQGNDLKYTLIRFLTSKGEKKDAEAVNRLTEKEVASIEGGIANAKYQNLSDLEGRLHEVIWEVDNYRKGGNASGHSLTQRFEFWKAALGIIKQNPIIGVGTGDAKIAYAEQYNKMNSSLAENNRLRAHNQYLAITVATGVLGLMIFLISLLYPLVNEKRYFDYLYVTFFLIAVISMFGEDTLETQAGVTFFAFFNSLLLFARPKDIFSRKPI